MYAFFRLLFLGCAVFPSRNSWELVRSIFFGVVYFGRMGLTWHGSRRAGDRWIHAGGAGHPESVSSCFSAGIVGPRVVAAFVDGTRAAGGRVLMSGGRIANSLVRVLSGKSQSKTGLLCEHRHIIVRLCAEGLLGDPHVLLDWRS